MVLSGRKAQAARNDDRILHAARAVFTADPSAPISAVAQQAGVGMSALYRRYRSKDELLQRLCIDAVRAYAEVAEAAATSRADAWESFVWFMKEALDNGSGTLTIRLAGHFTITQELRDELPRAMEHSSRVLDRAKRGGHVRDEIEVGDLPLILQQVQAVDAGDAGRTGRLRHRYLLLMLEGMRVTDRGPLPGPAPSLAEIGHRYQKGAA